MGAKRKSGDGPGSAKQPKLTDAPLKVPVEALLKERVQRFDKWLFLGCVPPQPTT